MTKSGYLQWIVEQNFLKSIIV